MEVLDSLAIQFFFHQMSMITHFYLMGINVNGDFDIFEKLNSTPSLVQKLFDIRTKTLKCNDVELDYHFLLSVKYVSKTPACISMLDIFVYIYI